MAVKSEPYWWLECDKCGEKSTEGGDFTAWGDVDLAESDAEDGGWMVAGRNGAPESAGHLCEDCAVAVTCPECGEYRPADGACADQECGWTPEPPADAADTLTAGTVPVPADTASREVTR